MKLEGSLRETPIFALIEQIDSAEATCVLHIEDASGNLRFVFVDGDLHLSGRHPLAAALRGMLATGGADRQQDAEVKLHLGELVRRIAERLGRCRDGSFRIEPGADSEEVVGPIPSELLVIEGTVAQADPETLLRSLGGEEATLFARDDGSEAAPLVELEPGLRELLGQLATPRSVADVLASRADDRGRVIADLARLRASGAVVSLPAREPSGVDQRPADAVAPLVARLLARIGRSLEERPLDLDPAEQRRELARLVSELGALDHYQLLGIEVTADEQTLHRAYEEVARRVHPSNAARLGWEQREGVLRLLFERLTEAYRVLSDPERRSRYHREAGITREFRQSTEERREEMEGVARTHFERARELVGREDYFQACELVKQAIQISPRADYYALLGSIQTRNPKWLREAQDSYRRALDLEPDNTEYRLALARLYERSGEVDRAKVYYRAVSAREPDDPAARAALSRLARYGSAKVGERRRGGVLGWLRGLFGRG